MYHQHCSTF